MYTGFSLHRSLQPKFLSDFEVGQNVQPEKSTISDRTPLHQQYGKYLKNNLTTLFRMGKARREFATEIII